MTSDIVVDYGNYFLRDDRKIREDAGMVPGEAYSLFRRNPYGRVIVLVGPLDWAQREAAKEMDNDRENDHRNSGGN